MSTNLIIIDPQNDFCHPLGALYVPGADKDCERLASFIRKNISSLDSIHVTLDSHQEVDIAHPCMYKDSQGNAPSNFTIMRLENDRIMGKLENPETGEVVYDREFNVSFSSRIVKWNGQETTLLQHVKYYIKALDENGKYPLCIWPPHCRIGETRIIEQDGVSIPFSGHAVYAPVAQAMYEWNAATFNSINFISKGTNPLTEHYSGMQADVQDSEDKSTHMNVDLVCSVLRSDRTILTGQALSHCVANTGRDLIESLNRVGSLFVSKLVLLSDTCSNVPGYEDLGELFVDDCMRCGVGVTTTEELILS